MVLLLTYQLFKKKVLLVIIFFQNKTKTSIRHLLELTALRVTKNLAGIYCFLSQSCSKISSFFINLLKEKKTQIEHVINKH